MQINIDIEGLVSRSIIDGILNQNNVQKEIDKILRSDDCQKILIGHVKTRLNEILSSEYGKEQIDKSIIEKVAESDDVQDKIEEILEGCEQQDMLEKSAKACLQEVISSEEGKKMILNKVKEFLENYDIECDDDFNGELNKWISEMLLMTMKEIFSKLKTSIKQDT